MLPLEMFPCWMIKEPFVITELSMNKDWIKWAFSIFPFVMCNVLSVKVDAEMTWQSMFCVHDTLLTSKWSQSTTLLAMYKAFVIFPFWILSDSFDKVTVLMDRASMACTFDRVPFVMSRVLSVKVDAEMTWQSMFCVHDTLLASKWSHWTTLLEIDEASAMFPFWINKPTQCNDTTLAMDPLWILKTWSEMTLPDTFEKSTHEPDISVTLLMCPFSRFKTPSVKILDCK